MFNFEETVEVLREASGAVQVGSAAQLASELGRLASDLAAREALGAAARAAIRKRQGAAELTAGLIAKVLARRT
jgi:3-deoxy-D-manno-octulosonic-acid transferase